MRSALKKKYGSNKVIKIFNYHDSPLIATFELLRFSEVQNDAHLNFK
jgi:hypothetical protein